jgi:hypothetical protein
MHEDCFAVCTSFQTLEHPEQSTPMETGREKEEWEEQSGEDAS